MKNPEDIEEHVFGGQRSQGNPYEGSFDRWVADELPDGLPDELLHEGGLLNAFLRILEGVKRLSSCPFSEIRLSRLVTPILGTSFRS
jgi:hypothetical protein